jgi:hypothetical protein
VAATKSTRTAQRLTSPRSRRAATKTATRNRGDGARAAAEPDLHDLARRVARLEAEREISRVLYHYVWLADEVKDADRISACFTKDAVWEGVGDFDEYLSEGRDQIRDLFRDVPNQLPFTAHWVTNEVIDLANDGEHAHGQWHILEAANLRDNCAQVWMVAWYENDFRRVNGKWLISHLRLVHTFVAPYEEGWLKTRYVSPVTLMKVSRL